MILKDISIYFLYIFFTVPSVNFTMLSPGHCNMP